MSKQRIYSSNAEKQKAYRLRKKEKENAHIRNSNSNKDESVTVTIDQKKVPPKKRFIKREIIDDGPGIVASQTISDLDIEKIYEKIPKPKENKKKEIKVSFTNILIELEKSDSFVAIKLKKKLFGSSKHNKNNKEYTERNLHDFFVFLKELKIIE